MKKILSVLLIILILCANALVLTYKYSFFSETIYKIENKKSYKNISNLNYKNTYDSSNDSNEKEIVNM